MIRRVTFMLCSPGPWKLGYQVIAASNGVSSRTFFSGLSEEHRMLQKTCRDFAEKEIKPVAAHNDEHEIYPRGIIKKLGELGLMGVFIPQEMGGSGLDTLSYSIAIEEISKACAGTGVSVAVHHLYLGAVYRLATPDQIKKFITPFTTGDRIACYALSEPGNGSDAAALTTTATRKGDKVVHNIGIQCNCMS
ncbi:short-chain specific acyl-CoA dehydrogenase [Tropilaelaps mercedesae]|uniref:Short-chain specific acyl-CoA dehydrogenase n=1 Tax=Tropilaelaps mercedesae TaxID=418985 RepID=A0A1V9XZ04_9ACAR|nr:short-chain specific acyl-CoA dehydrogenase [Tropilaelaps mercedesae]